MVELTALLVPILVSAVLVFLTSSVIHMVLPYHRSDYDAMPDEDSVLELLRGQKLGHGNYLAPHCVSPEDRKSPEKMAKVEKGPMAFITVIPKPAMGKNLLSWFIFCVVMGILVGYVGTFTLEAGTDYRKVFRLIGTVAFLGYAGSASTEAIWMGRKWSSALKHTFDGLLYGLVTAGVFGWLWPS